MAEKPIVQSLVLADHIYVDGPTGKKVIAGTFNRIWAPQFPFVSSQRPWVFIAVTNVRGEAGLRLQLRNLNTNEVVGETQELIVVLAETPLVTADAVIQMPNILFPSAGTYSIDILYDDEILGSYRLIVAQRSIEANQ